MKVRAISIAIVLAGITGVAAAGNGNTMQSVTLPGSAVAQCVPPDDNGGAACERFHRLIRAHFTPREIGMLFGSRTGYPEYLTGGIDRLQRRYEALVQGYLAGQMPAEADSLAGK